MSIGIERVVSLAALAFRAYEMLGQVARAQGMSAEEFHDAVGTECARLDEWIAATNSAEDAVFGDMQ